MICPYKAIDGAYAHIWDAHIGRLATQRGGNMPISGDVGYGLMSQIDEVVPHKHTLRCINERNRQRKLGNRVDTI